MQPTYADRRRRLRETWGSAIVRAFRARARRTRHRSHYRELLSFDDHVLRDMGITRDRVHHELQKTYR